MPRIFVSPTRVKDNLLSITGDNARYLASVLRCRKGDELLVFDGRGNCFKTKILKFGKREVTAEVLEKCICNTESHIDIFLIQGLLKGQKMDMVIQKVTELGVKEILPVITERSNLRETKKIFRWRKIAEEASKQCGRTIVPAIHEPLEFNRFFTSHEQSSRNGLIFWEEGGISLRKAVTKISSSPIYLLIGPEGGFTKEEVSLAEEKGFMRISLGKRILRSETAAISAVALVQFLLGDLG